MSRNIERFVPPMEEFVVWEGGFTNEECDLIVQTGELFEFNKAGVGPSGGVNEDVRKTNVTWIEAYEEHKWLFERMHTIVAKVNYDKFQLNLRRFDGFQYTKYEDGAHYTWHKDVSLEPTPDGLYRKLSVVLMLSDISEYEGGDLLICDSGTFENVKNYKFKKGDVGFFYSTTPHKVEPVTSGTRLTLVTWCLGEKIK